MPNDTVEYRGHTINWDVAQISGTNCWKATGSVTWSDASGISNVRPISGVADRFDSEVDAKHSVLKLAKECIDKQAK
jgi:hypothetical protein